LKSCRIREKRNSIKSFYILEEINNIILKEIYSDNRLKKYIDREKDCQIFAKSKNKNKKIEKK